MSTKSSSPTKNLKSLWNASEQVVEEEPKSLHQQLEEEMILLQILELEISQLRKQKEVAEERIQVLKYLLGERRGLTNPLAPSGNVPYHMKELTGETSR